MAAGGTPSHRDTTPLTAVFGATTAPVRRGLWTPWICIRVSPLVRDDPGTPLFENTDERQLVNQFRQLGTRG
jgi:hypothetical protein